MDRDPMLVIAVVQTDRIIVEANLRSSLESLLFFHRQLSILASSQRVDEWICEVSHANFQAIPPAIPATLGMRLYRTGSGDPLDQFHRMVSDEPFSTSAANSDPIVLRIVLTAEDPDPCLIDRMIDHHQTRRYDFSFRDFDEHAGITPIELMNYSALDEAKREALLPDDRELITPYIYRQRDRLNIGSFNARDSANGQSPGLPFS